MKMARVSLQSGLWRKHGCPHCRHSPIDSMNLCQMQICNKKCHHDSMLLRVVYRLHVSFNLFSIPYIPTSFDYRLRHNMLFMIISDTNLNFDRKNEILFQQFHNKMIFDIKNIHHSTFRGQVQNLNKKYVLHNLCFMFLRNNIGIW